jgi:hypothetical protein
MDRSPFDAQGGDLRRERVLDAVQVRQLEPETLTHLRRSMRRMQVENSLSVRTFDMDVRGSVVVRPDHDAEAVHA